MRYWNDFGGFGNGYGGWGVKKTNTGCFLQLYIEKLIQEMFYNPEFIRVRLPLRQRLPDGIHVDLRAVEIAVLQELLAYIYN